MNFRRVIDTKIGFLTLGSDGESLTELSFGSNTVEPGKTPCPLLDTTENQVREYLDGRRRTFDLPLLFDGSEFERSVYNALLAIPYGEVMSYADVARAIGRPRACRAVGNAAGKNRIAVIIPCHRLVSSSGIGGFGRGFLGGIEIKRALLAIESSP